MSGKPKQGLDYAGWSVNMFDGDTKIDKLLEAQGWVGFGIYFYLCQMAYKFDGYFYRWSYGDSVTTARRMGGGVRSETVNQTVGLCLQIGLFDKRLFDRDGILTSRGIQRRFCAAIQKRRRKVVIKDYWLLDEEESKGLELCAADADSLPADADSLPANNGSLPANAIKVKESKGKESKEPDGGGFASSAGGFGFGPELDAVLAEWLIYKEEKRQPYEKTALKSLLKQTRKNVDVYGEDAVVNLIQECMSSNWQGIIWSQLKKPQAKSSDSGDVAWMKKYIQQRGEGGT